MIKKILNWHKERISKNKAESYIAGYDYAAGRLLRREGGATAYLQSEVDLALHFDDYSDFDRGIEDAIGDVVSFNGGIKEDET